LGFENEMKQILSQLKITDLSAKMGNFRVDKSNVLLWQNFDRNQSATHSYFVDYGRAYQSPGCGNGRMARKLFE
jgi:hypothetical protein